MKTTHNCEGCKFREWVGDSGLRCTLGHKPRFYNPRRGERFADGWRRRCDDFQMGKHVRLFVVSKA
jgi:hypothetical protein